MEASVTDLGLKVTVRESLSEELKLRDFLSLRVVVCVVETEKVLLELADKVA